MAIDLFREQPITLFDAAKMFPKNARGSFPHISQLYRYSTRGLKGVVLETLQCGSKRCTSREAVVRFIEALTVKASGTNGIVPKTVSEPLDIDSELDRIGISASTNSQLRKEEKRKEVRPS